MPRRSKLVILGLIVTVIVGTIPLLLMYPRASNTQKQSNGHSEPNDTNTTIVIIVPGVRIGDYTLGMSKDEVLKGLGEPKEIFYGRENYTLNNLPKQYYMSFADIVFEIVDDSVHSITVNSRLYKFTNGLRVGDSEEKIKQAFGDDFDLTEGRKEDILTYEGEGLTFEINKEDRTVTEISIGKKIEAIIIVPGLGVGNYTLGMSKDEVLNRLGEPKRIFYEGESYTLNNLPKRYYMSFADIVFEIVDDSVHSITVNSRLYKFTNGLRVGDSEKKIKQAFGDDFDLIEGREEDILTYEGEGLTFEINKKDRTVTEISVIRKISRVHSEPNEPNTIVPEPPVEEGQGSSSVGVNSELTPGKLRSD